jgi:hypothetical protein
MAGSSARLPLSGAVEQWIRTFGQIGLVNIVFPGRGTDPPLEAAILEDYGYGRQLGRVVGALEVLLTHCQERLAEAPLSDAERDALEGFRSMASEIRRAKVRQRGG